MKKSAPLKNRKSLGILGGMGPFASAEFLMTILSNFHADNDSQYPRIIMDSNTWIPSRSRAFLYGEASPVPGMIASCRALEGYGVDYIAIPCNSAQAWLNELQPLISTPILDIREITTEALINSFPHCNQAIVLGGPVTYGLDTYKLYLEKRDIEYLKINAIEQKSVEDIIYACKKNIDRQILNEMYSRVLLSFEKKYGPQCVKILGCTEFGLLAFPSMDLCLVDSMLEYAAFTAKLLDYRDEFDK